MIVFNKNKYKLLTNKGKIAQGLDQITGMITDSESEAIYFQTRFGIHTFLMKKDIDVIVLDSKNNVIKMKKNLEPNRFFFWDPKFSKVLELNSGIIDKTNTQIGDLIEIK